MPHKEIVKIVSEEVPSLWWCQKITSGFEQHQGRRVLGQIENGLFQIGAQRTFVVSASEAWEVIMSEEGITEWLGEIKELKFAPKGKYEIQKGISGQINVLKKGSHIRMTWQPKRWPSPSLLQIRIIHKGNKTAISFHHEGLPGITERQKMLSTGKRYC